MVDNLAKQPPDCKKLKKLLLDTPDALAARNVTND